MNTTTIRVTVYSIIGITIAYIIGFYAINDGHYRSRIKKTMSDKNVFHAVVIENDKLDQLYEIVYAPMIFITGQRLWHVYRNGSEGEFRKDL